MYKTDSALIKHLFKDLVPQIIKKYEFTTQEVYKILDVKKIMLNKAKEIENENQRT